MKNRLIIFVLLVNLSLAYAGPSNDQSGGDGRPIDPKRSESGQPELHWLVDYIMMASGLPREEAIQSLNRTQEVFDGFQGKTKTEFGVFLLNQKDLKPLLTEKVIRDVLFMWTVEILKERPLSETNSQKLLIYWAEATQQYAMGTEYSERLHEMLIALGEALPSVPAMVDWYEALDVIVQEKREGSDLALKQYLHVIEDNWILNMVIAQNTYNILPKAWCETLDQNHIFSMTPLEMIYLSSECWKESTEIAKTALFKTPEGDEIDQLDEISKRGEHPLFYIRDAYHKYRLLLLKSVVKDVLHVAPQDIRFTPEDEILLKQMAIGLSQDISLEDMTPEEVSQTVHEFITAYQKASQDQNQIKTQNDMKQKLALLWFVRFAPLLSQESWTDDERRFVEEVLIRPNQKIHPLLALAFKPVLTTEQWTRIKFEVYAALLSETEFENIYFRMAVIHNSIIQLKNAAALPEDHLEAYLLGNYLRRAFQKDMKELQFPLIVTHEKNPVPTIYFNHYQELRMLQSAIAPDFLSQGIVTLPEDFVQSMAPDMLLYMKAKLAHEGKLELTAEENKMLMDQFLLFKNDGEEKPIKERTLKESFIPHVYSALYSVGRALDEESLISDYKRILPPVVDLYREQESLSPEQFEAASQMLIDTLKSMDNAEFEKAHLKTYFMKWFPEHIRKGEKESQKILSEDLIQLTSSPVILSAKREGSPSLTPQESQKLHANRLDFVIHMLSTLPHTTHEDGHHYEALIAAAHLLSKYQEDLESHDMRRALVNLYSAFVDGFDLNSRDKLFMGDIHKARKAFLELIRVAFFQNPVPLEDITEDERVDLAVKTQWWLKSYLTSYQPETGPVFGVTYGGTFSFDNTGNRNSDTQTSERSNDGALTNQTLVDLTRALDESGEILPPLEYRDQNFVYGMLVSRFVNRIFGPLTDRSTDELEQLYAAATSHSEASSVDVVLFQGFIEYIKSGALLNLYQGMRNFIQIVGLDARDIPLYFVIQKIHEREPQIENRPAYDEDEYMEHLGDYWLVRHHEEEKK